MPSRKKRSRSDAFEAKMRACVAECLDRLDPALEITADVQFQRDALRWNVCGESVWDWSLEDASALPRYVQLRDALVKQASALRGMIAISDEMVPEAFAHMNKQYDGVVEQCTMIGREPMHGLRRLHERILSAALLYPALARTYREVDGDQRLADMGIVKGQFTIFEPKPARPGKRVR